MFFSRIQGYFWGLFYTKIKNHKAFLVLFAVYGSKKVMTEYDRTLRQIDKILALVDSDQDGEALSALRVARRMMATQGISFTDLIGQAKRGRLISLRGLFSDNIRRFEEEIDALHQEINALNGEKALLELRITQQENETQRWKDIARESADKLWDIGSLAHAQAVLELETAQLEKPKAKSRQRRRAAG